MKYEIFDQLSNKKSRNKIIAYLQHEARTFDEIAKETDMDRTSVFYHIKQMENEGKIIKRFIGKTCYIGLIQKERTHKSKKTGE